MTAVVILAELVVLSGLADALAILERRRGSSNGAVRPPCPHTTPAGQVDGTVGCPTARSMTCARMARFRRRVARCRRPLSPVGRRRTWGTQHPAEVR